MSSDTVRELTEIEHKLAAAFVAGDSSFHAAVLADDWSVIDPAGSILSKADVLENAFSGKREIKGEIDQIKVRDFGEWAVVTGRTRMIGRLRDEEINVTLRFTDVFSHSSGKWQCVASQGTLVNG